MPLAGRRSSRLADPLVPPSRRARSAQEYLKAPSSVPPPPRRRRQRIVYPLPAAFGTLALPVTKRSALFFSLCAVLIRRTSLARLTWGRARLASRAQGRELSAGERKQDGLEAALEPLTRSLSHCSLSLSPPAQPRSTRYYARCASLHLRALERRRALVADDVCEVGRPRAALGRLGLRRVGLPADLWAGEGATGRQRVRE